MDKPSIEFMLKEYEQIASAFFGLRDQINEYFKTYVALIGLPLTILAAAQRIGGGQVISSILDLPEIVSALLILVSLLGLFITLSIISMRMEMILYARTINNVRRYFTELDLQIVIEDKSIKLRDYLILPTCDRRPGFFEPWRAMFWQVLMIGFIDGIIFSVAIQSLLGVGWCWSIFLGVVYWLAHALIYYGLAKKNEKDWNVAFPKSLNIDHV